ncbi:MAG: DUF881 domain-containing protein [Alkaliphilus sp.]
MKKKKYTVILFLSFVFIGTILSINFSELTKLREVEFSLPLSKFETEEVAALRRENADKKQKIEVLNSKAREHEELHAKLSYPLKKLKEEVDHYRFLSGQTDVAGTGIVVSIEGSFGENIAMLVEQNNYLVKLVNELKVFGAEAISINNHRITARSEMVLAGNHINVNMTPIAPPYVVSAIGNYDRFRRYAKFHTVIFDDMINDGLDVDIQFSEELVMQAVIRERPIRFLEIRDED